MDELVEMTNARWLRNGRISQRAEPDLKHGRGGLRDVQLLNALALAQLIDRHSMANHDSPGGSLDDAHLTLLDVRTELHRVSGRGRDQLLAQFADEITKVLTKLSFEIKTEIRFIPNAAGAKKPPEGEEDTASPTAGAGRPPGPLGGSSKPAAAAGSGKFPKPEVTAHVSIKDRGKDARRS